ncbi:MAG: GNAT family N-acetyltransferase [Steroidobacteraceae bacterium]|jgi:predicted GNAT family N-acyltransferase|nr:GNAT family N-acetyltransferase [Steroidobacteraceae bacterium]
MPDRPHIDIRVTSWERDGAALGAIRREVFVFEQGVPEDIEWDGQDTACAHVIALANREPVGTGRLLPTGKIGRLAVLAPFRRHGVGRAMLARLVDLARERGLREVYLHAQVSALGFYTAYGFVAEGPEFEEAGIVHRRLRLVLAEAPVAADQRSSAAPARDP